MTTPLPNALVPDIRTVAAVIIQTSINGLPTADSGWTTQRFLRFDGGSDGVAPILGEATLVQDFGELMPQGGTAFAAVGIAPDIGRRGTTAPLIGQIVRLLKKDGGGTIIDGAGYTPFWWGRLIASRWVPDRAGRISGGRMTWSAVGLGSILDQIALNRGKVLAPSGGQVRDVGYLPPFNGQPGGDRSGSTVTVNGRSVYVHDVANGTSGNPWTARQIVEHLLAVGTVGEPSRNGNTQPDDSHFGWDIQLGTVGTLLDWTAPSIDLAGMTLFQALNAVIARKRSLVWKITVSGSTVLLNVYSGSGTSISVGSFVLPASTYTAALDAEEARWLADLEVVQDQSSTYDLVEIRGGYPWVGLTLSYVAAGGGRLLGVGSGWTAAQEIEWDKQPARPTFAAVWRLFEVDPAWTGVAYDGTQALNDTSNSGGQRSASLLPAPARLISGERMIPASLGFSTLLVGPRQPPVVVATNDGVYYADISPRVTVEVHSDPLAVTIDDGANGTWLNGIMNAPSAAFLVTLGVRETEPLRVWNGSGRASSSPTPAIKLIDLPNLEQWRVVVGTVTGVDTGTVTENYQPQGVLTTLTSDLVIRDDTHILSDALALAVAWFCQPTYLVRWTDRANLDVGDTYAPGRLLTSVELSDTAIGMYAVIMRRRWVPVDRGGVRCIDTSYETERVIPDLEAVL